MLLAALLLDGFSQCLGLKLFVAHGRSLLKGCNGSAQSLAGQFGGRGLLRLWLRFYLYLYLYRYFRLRNINGRNVTQQVIKVGFKTFFHGVQFRQQGAEAGFILGLFRLGTFVGQGLKMRRHRSVVEIEDRIRFQLTQLRQRRQFVEALEVEVIEKPLGGCEHRGFARHVAIAHHADPFALKQGFDDMAVDRHTSHIFNFAPSNGLAIGNQRHGFKHGSRVALRTLFPQAPDPRRVLFADLQAIA